jgi:predicted Zn-dependent protease
MNAVSVACRRADAGWTCSVTVGTDGDATHHVVTVADQEMQTLAPSAADPVELVEASFRFLLAREPRESILRSFELPVIGRYFPEWDAEIRRMTGG